MAGPEAGHDEKGESGRARTAPRPARHDDGERAGSTPLTSRWSPGGCI